jgi:cobalt-zinc-cadmium efflux system membrane fusion protein
MATAVVLLGVVLLSRGGGKGGSSKGEPVAVKRGNVAVTVGGIGHVTTLTGAAKLSVPSSSSSGSASGAAGGGGGAGAGTGTAGGSGAGGGAASGGGTTVPADAVFPAMAGHVARLLVKPGDHVVAGQPVAILSDDGTTATSLLQARNDFATARLELAQKRVQDPTRGAPPTAAEVQAGQQGVLTAQAKLQKILGPPMPAEVATARSDVGKALADLNAARVGNTSAVSAAELAVTTAQQKLQMLTGAPNPADLATAQLDLAKATLDRETLLTNTPNPTPAERAAAQLAIDAAQQKLNQVLRPPSSVVSAARQEVAKSEADLAAIKESRQGAGLRAARAAVGAAKSKLRQLLGSPQRDLVATARLDMRKARADLAVLRQRGGPAGATDLSLARLKVDVTGQRLRLTQDLGRRLTVLAGSSGTVTSLLTTRGAAVDATTPVMRVQDLSHLVVALDLSEFDVGRITAGSDARISVDALGGKRFGGHVSDVALTGNETNGVVNFPVTIALSSAQRLRPGMSVSARVVVKSRRNVVRVPAGAVNDQGDSPSVMVQGRPGVYSKRTVEVGLADPQFVEVRSGLKVGERVLVPTG